jgi:hypothetical protein
LLGINGSYVMWTLPLVCGNRKRESESITDRFRIARDPSTIHFQEIKTT